MPQNKTKSGVLDDLNTSDDLSPAESDLSNDLMVDDDVLTGSVTDPGVDSTDIFEEETLVSPEPVSVPAWSSDDTSSTSGESKPVTEQAQQKAGELVTQAKETTGNLVGKFSEQAVSRLEEQKSHTANGLSAVADTLRQTGQTLRENEQGPIAQYAAQYGEAAAGQVEHLAIYLLDRDVNQMVHEVEDFARRQPAIFVGGAFLLGLLAGRFLKSTPPTTSGESYNQSSHASNQSSYASTNYGNTGYAGTGSTATNKDNSGYASVGYDSTTGEYSGLGTSGTGTSGTGTDYIGAGTGGTGTDGDSVPTADSGTDYGSGGSGALT